MSPVITDDVRNILEVIKQNCGLSAFEARNLGPRTLRAIGQALDDDLLRDDSSGWDEEVRYVLTGKGEKALGIQPWWRSIFASISAALPERASLMFRTSLPAACLIVAMCGIVLSALLVSRDNGQMIRHAGVVGPLFSTQSR
jgi:hypothetical protein